MTRKALIERIKRQIYGGFPNDDSQITDNLINLWINDGVSIAAKKNYTDNFQLEGIGYINNSFYTTFKNLSISFDENNLWKIQLPQLPIGVGKNEGVSTLQFKSEDKKKITYPATPLSENQKGYYSFMRPISDKILYYPEGEFIYVISPLILNTYTAIVSIVSGGDSSTLLSTINVPDDYIPNVIDYVSKMLMLERAQVQDQSNDGVDNKG